MKPLRTLIVSYLFPPTGGAGVGRVLKLVKYLPDHNVLPTVLTAKNPSVPVIDHSLEKDISPSLPIVRARTFEPGYGVKQAVWSSQGAAPSLSRRAVSKAASLAKQALIPDPQVLWLPDASRILASRLLRGLDDVVFFSAPPFSAFLAAPLVRLHPRTALVLDYRDEWSTLRTTYEMLAGRSAAWLGGAMETAVVRSAHAITTATEAFRSHLLDRFSFLDPAHVVAIPNGYDIHDFPAYLPEPPNNRFVITYAGTIFKLTSARGLLGAIRLLHDRAPSLASRLEVRFLGRIVDTELDSFEGTEALGVKCLGYVPKEQVMSELSASHMVLCLLDDVAGVERIYPAKIFELMHLERPCLTLSPPGVLTELVERHQLGAIIAPRDEAAIAEFLEKALRSFEAGTYSIRAPAVDTKRFDRRALAGEFARVFREASSRTAS
ncbi:MAG: glycosyltransferase [Myxococcales bacterium]